MKPENVLLDPKHDNQIKVIDFGASQQFDPEQRMNKIYGTAYYIAPEILKSDYTEKCDVWSVGVILYILLSGVPPFAGQNDREIMQAVKRGTFSLSLPEFKCVSADAKDLIKKMLKYDPKDRLSAEKALQHAWIKKRGREDVDEDATVSALNNLRSFNVLLILFIV